MAEDKQPTAGEVEDEMQSTAKSAEDRKAAAALSKLDTHDESSSAAPAVDQEAVKNAMNALGGAAGTSAPKAEVKKVKVDTADVNLLVDQLELSKPKATELLKAWDGNAIDAMRDYLRPEFF